MFNLDGPYMNCSTPDIGHICELKEHVQITMVLFLACKAH